MNNQAWFPLELAGLISKGLSRVCIYGYRSLPFHHTCRFTVTITVVRMQDDSSPQSPPWFCPILITPSHRTPPLWQPLTIVQFHDIVISRMLYKWNCRGHDVLRWAYYLHHSSVLPRSIPRCGWTYRTSLRVSLIKGHLGWLQFVTTTNKLLWTIVYMFLHEHKFYFSDIYPKVLIPRCAIDRSYDKNICGFLGNTKLFSREAVPTKYARSRLSAPLPAVGVIIIFLFFN